MTSVPAAAISSLRLWMKRWHSSRSAASSSAIRVAEVARDAGVGWHTIMRATRDYGEELLDDPDRMAGVAALGMDETAFLRASREP